MVTNMSETRDPRSKNVPVDWDDDDDIIELTEEVIVKPKKDDDIMDHQGPRAAAPESQAAKPLETDDTEAQPDDEADDAIDLSAAPEYETDGSILDLDEAFADDDTNMGEDDIIASAIEESLGADDDDDEPEPIEDRIRLTDDAEVEMAEDVDIIHFSEEGDETAEVSDAAAAEADTGEGIFQDEEEIPLEYESSEDEYDFFALDDNKPLEELETITMAGEEQLSLEDEDASVDPLAELDFGTDEDDDIIAMDAEAPDAPELMAFDDEGEALKFEAGDDLPDLTDEIEFDFDDDAEDDGLAEADDDGVDDSDDIIARAVEKSMAPDEVSSQVDLTGEREFEYLENTDTIAEEDAGLTDEALTAQTAEELRKLAEADDWDDIDDDMDLEFDDEAQGAEIADISDLEPEAETMTLEDLEDVREEDDDIIEITEFDEHFPEEDELKLAHAGVLDVADGDEDDFLELIEIEEDDTTEDEEVIEFSQSEARSDEDEIDSFFSETLADAPAFEDGEIEPVAETPALSTDMSLATAPSADDDEEFDFGIDSSMISQQVDRLDTFLADDPAGEPAVASLPSEPEVAAPPSAPPAEEETPHEDQAADEQPAESVSVAPDQIDAIVERVIEEKFGGNIETIIYEVIEKAVSKEIDRLKGALLGDGGGDDSQES